MPDSRNIVRSGDKGSGFSPQPAAGFQNSDAAERTATGRIEVDTDGSALPMPLLAESPKRKSAIIYNPAVDPLDGLTGGNVVWIGLDSRTADRSWFPLEVGGTYTHQSTGWLHGWTGAGAPTRLYIIEELY